MQKVPRGLRNAALIVSAFFGRFGANQNTSPEQWSEPVDIQGTGPGKAASRHAKIFSAQKRRKLTKRGIAFLAQAANRRKAIYNARIIPDAQVAGSMRGSEWLRENRRLRSAGLSQNRAI